MVHLEGGVPCAMVGRRELREYIAHYLLLLTTYHLEGGVPCAMVGRRELREYIGGIAIGRLWVWVEG